MNNFNEIKEKVESSKNILVTSHVNPDGDAIGAGLALTLALRKWNKNTRFILQDNYPSNLEFITKIKDIESYNPNINYDYDLIICVDGATADRLGETQNLLKEKFTINFDHHISNTKYGNLNYVEEISSTSEIIYNFINFCNIELDIEIGECLYTGLVNDTGNFSHDNVTEKTFEMAAHLRKIGVDNSKIVREFFNTKSFASIKLLGKAMYDLEFNSEKKLSYCFISQEDLKKFNGKKEDTEGIVEKLLALKEAEVALFLREDKPNIIKGSMRSKHDIDVNKIAGLFGGGGHRKASGFTSELPYQEIVKIVLENL